MSYPLFLSFLRKDPGRVFILEFLNKKSHSTKTLEALLKIIN
jgi:hypothetical protein